MPTTTGIVRGEGYQSVVAGLDGVQDSKYETKKPS
jgi:hypothetical protein